MTDGTRQDGPLSLAPAGSHTVHEKGRRAARVREYRDPQGCLIAEKWDIAGMDHFWTGGTTDPQYAEFTDPTAPNGAEATWAFFKRFRRDGTARVDLRGLPAAHIRATLTGRTRRGRLSRETRVYKTCSARPAVAASRQR